MTAVDDLFDARNFCLTALVAAMGDAWTDRRRTIAAISWTEGPGGMRPAVVEGSEVLVRAHFGPPERPMTDVIPVADLARYHQAGLPISGIGAPGAPQPAIWAVFGVGVVPEGLVGLLAFDWAGCAGLLASGHPSASAVRDHLLDRAHHKDRQRAQALTKEIGRQTFADSFTTAASMYLREDPFSRGVERLPLATWRLDLWLDGQPFQYDNWGRPTEPLTRAATAGISSVAVDTWGTTRPNGETSNRRHQFLHEMAQPEWSDPTGDFASALGDGRVPLERAMATIGDADRVIDGWRRAGLTKREVLVRAMGQLGFSATEIGERIQRHRTTAGRALAAAEKKLAAARTV